MLAAWTLPISFEQPVWLWLLLLTPVVAVVSWKTMRALEAPRRILAIALRIIVLTLVAFCLAGIQYVKSSDKLTVFFLMDRSDSVKGLQETQEAYLQEVGKTIKNPEDRVGMIDFARGAFLQQLPMKGGYHIQPGRLPEMENRDRTNVAAAMRLAMAMFPADSGKRIVLMSDGNDNMGDVLSEAAAAQAQGVTVDVVPLWYEHSNEVFFDRIVAPTNAEDGDLVPLRMLLHAEAPTSGRIDIYQNGKLVEVPEGRDRVTLQRGNNPFMLKLPVKGGGPQRFEARFIPDGGGDSIEENNVATAFTYVRGKSKVLLLSTNPDDDAPLVEALASEKVDVALRDVSHERVDLLDLLQYSTVILANVPAHTFTDEQHRALTNYVNDLGGGLIMIGGDESFGTGGWIGSPVAQVMPVDFEIKHKKVIPRGALVLIMHSCEIPRGNYWGIEVAKKSVDTISSRDFIGVLAYSFSPGGVNWEVPLRLATDKSAIKKRIDRMTIGDMPDFHSTMRMGVDKLMETDAAQKHMIIISDGDPSPPSTGVIRDMIASKITCSTIGIGYGAHVVERTLRDIAKKTGGRFYACRNPRTLPQIFMKESKVVRRPLISEEVFQPAIAKGFAEMLTGLDLTGVPPLGGIVLTQAKPEAITPLVRPTDDGDDPVLSYWQSGLGKTVAFTSGLWRRWGGDWVNWSGFSKLWAQVVCWSMRQEAPANLDMFTRVEGEKGRVVVDAVDTDAGALNMLNLPAVIIKPDGESQPLLFNQTGPGRYEAKFDIDQTGQYIANVAVREQDQFKGSMQTGVSVPFSPEFRELATNEPLLREVVRVTGGRWHDDIGNPAGHNLFSHDFPPIVAKQPIWNWTLAWLLLPLFLLDVAIRRLASWLAFSIAVEGVVIVFLLFGLGTVYGPWWGILGTLALGELIGWMIRFQYISPAIDYLTHSVTALGHAGERSTASLDQLKGARQRVREERDTDRPGGAVRVTGRDDEGPVDTRRRYDVGDEKAAKQAGDLTDALGGAKADSESKPGERPGAEDQKDEQSDKGETTSRLLKAKRRAQRDMNDPNAKS